MQALCQLDALGKSFLAQLDDFLADDDPAESVQDYARKLVLAARDRLDELDAALQTVAENWELKRMATVDRNILRAAACELATCDNIPPKVVITEAVEIAKAFGTADSPAFINGVLDAIVKRRLLSANPSTAVDVPATDAPAEGVAKDDPPK